MNVCHKCGHNFDRAVNKVRFETVCPQCNSDRHRCEQTAMANDTACRHHAPTRAFSLLKIAAANVGDLVLEELLEHEGAMTFDEEVAVARAMVAQELSKPDGQRMSTKDLLELMNELLKLAERAKNIVNGKTLNININDDTVAEIKKHVRRFASAVNETLLEFVTDPVVRTQMLRRIQERTRLQGNPVTFARGRSQGQDWYTDPPPGLPPKTQPHTDFDEPDKGPTGTEGG